MLRQGALFTLLSFKGSFTFSYFQFLYRAGDAGYHVTDVELHNLVGIAGAIVLNGDASCNLLAILPFGSLLIADAGLLAAQAEVAV